jgi:hypothetical protein
VIGQLPSSGMRSDVSSDEPAHLAIFRLGSLGRRTALRYDVRNALLRMPVRTLQCDGKSHGGRLDNTTAKARWLNGPHGDGLDSPDCKAIVTGGPDSGRVTRPTSD